MSIDPRDLEASLEAGLAKHGVPGASIAVAHEDTVITAAGGVTNVDTGVPVTPDTVMHIGSITKVINATLVMQLVDEGRIALDEPVIRYLPELRLKDEAALRQITVKMLLNHTSGIDGSWLPDYGHDEETLDKAIARYAQLGQLFAPGTEWSYCNVAPVIAGYLVQRLRGKSWYGLVRERIFEPLRMDHAVTLPEEALLFRAAVGHYLDRESGALHRTSFAFGPLSFGPAGTTLMMSARELITFAQLHMAEGVACNGARILSARSTHAMQQQTVDNRGKGYTWDLDMGIGWTLPEPGLLHHAGGGPGVVSVLYVDPAKQWAAAILTNAAHGWGLANELMTPWLAALRWSKPVGTLAVKKDPVGVQEIDTERYIGTYEDVLTRFTVSAGASGLELSRQKKFGDCESVSTEPSPPASLTPLGNDQFLLETAGDLPEAARIVAFRNRDAAGRMRHLGTGGLHLRVS